MERMDLSVLPPGLTGDWRATTLGEDDVDEVFALVSADRTAVLGFSGVPREGVRLQISRAWPATAVGVCQERRLVQVWLAEVPPGARSAFGTVTSHPSLAADGALQALEVAGWRHLFAWVSAEEPDALDMRTQRPTTDRSGQERLHRLGFADERVLWVMETPVDAERVPSPHPPPEGLTLHAAADPRRVHELFMAGFAGTWGHREMPFDAFLTSRSAVPGNALELWFVAAVGGRPVGAMTLARAAPERAAMLISELAVLAPFRGRGIGTALLHRAFEAARADGMRLLYLFADSESDDVTTTLYASVGFEVVQGTQQLVRGLTPSTLA